MEAVVWFGLDKEVVLRIGFQKVNVKDWMYFETGEDVI